MNMNDMITLIQYAEMHGKAYSTIKEGYYKKRFKTAQKIGNQIFIDKNEPLIDRRKNTK